MAGNGSACLAPPAQLGERLFCAFERPISIIVHHHSMYLSNAQVSISYHIIEGMFRRLMTFCGACHGSVWEKSLATLDGIASFSPPCPETGNAPWQKVLSQRQLCRGRKRASSVHLCEPVGIGSQHHEANAASFTQWLKAARPFSSPCSRPTRPAGCRSCWNAMPLC